MRCRAAATDADILDLTEENVEKVLDEVRFPSFCSASSRVAGRRRRSPPSSPPPARARVPSFSRRALFCPPKKPHCTTKPTTPNESTGPPLPDGRRRQRRAGRGGRPGGQAQAQGRVRLVPVEPDDHDHGHQAAADGEDPGAFLVLRSFRGAVLHPYLAPFFWRRRPASRRRRPVSSDARPSPPSLSLACSLTQKTSFPLPPRTIPTDQTTPPPLCRRSSKWSRSWMRRPWASSSPPPTSTPC